MKKLQHIENEHTAELTANGLSIYKGWNDTVASELAARSKEPEIVKWAPRDRNERFTNITAANNWHREGSRTVYTLHKDSAVVGIIWFSYSLKPELQADYTLAVRMYDQVRGRGYTRAFMTAVHDDFRKEYQGNIWLVTDADNERAQKMYEHHGYRKVGIDNGRTLMQQKSGIQKPL
jgi:ribosomal protein S18 acetylase RimI-like enzyme